MIPWKNTLYAFLLRRVLGPWLDAASLRKLRESIEVSLHDGRLVLRQVGLNLAHINGRIGTSTVRIRRAVLDRLEVRLTLQEPEGAENSTLAWRAIQLGSGGVSSVSLFVRLEMDGLSIDVEPRLGEPPKPDPMEKAKDDTADAESPTTDTPRGMLASYIDAALASLRLSCSVTNTQVQIFDRPVDIFENAEWIKVAVKALHYHDVETETARTVSVSGIASESAYTTMIHKALEITRISVTTGVLQDSSEMAEATPQTKGSNMALLDGTSTLRLQVQQHQTSGLVRHDVDVDMDQKLSFLFDVDSLLRLRSLTAAYSSSQRHTIDNTEHDESIPAADTASTSIEEDEEAVEADLRTIDGIMQQYQEARVAAERKEFRGGLLLPDESSAAQDGEVTFDAFFDANDQSLYQYSTLLQSMMDENADSSASKMKFRYRLASASVKIELPRDATSLQTTKVAPDYILASLSDIHASCSGATRLSDVSFSIAHIDIEDALHDLDTGILRIGTFLQLSHSTADDDALIDSPALSVAVAVNRTASVVDLDIDVALQFLEFAYRSRMLEGIAIFASRISDGSIQKNESDTNDTGNSATDRTVRVHGSCPGIQMSLVVETEKDWAPLFDRYKVHCNAIGARLPSLCLHFDQILFDYSDGSDSSIDIAVATERLVLYAMAPSSGRTVNRFDILALYGRNEVVPVVPISGTYRRDFSPQSGQLFFPTVRTVSSFKARQDDDDEDSPSADNPIPDRDIHDTTTQATMLSRANSCGSYLTVAVPEVVFDLGISEISFILDILSAIRSPEDVSSTETVTSCDASPGIGLFLSVEEASVALHDTSGERSLSSSSVILKNYGLKVHSVIADSACQHIRLVLNDSELHQVDDLVERYEYSQAATIDESIDRLRNRQCCGEKAAAYPLVHRSQMFDPISNEIPALLIDMVVDDHSRTSSASTKKRLLVVHAYGLTCRVDLEGRFEKVAALLKRLTDRKKSEDVPVQDDAAGDGSHVSHSSLIRTFIDFGDCNLDYMSPARYRNPSRLILRFGDLRLSSNVVLPKPSMQTISVSSNDIALLISNARHSWAFENAKLRGNESLRLQQDKSHFAMSADGAKRALNYRTILTLDFFDSSLAFCGDKSSFSPFVTVNLSMGELSILACKDSLNHFLATISDLSAELTAVNQATVTELVHKDEASAALSESTKTSGDSPEKEGVLGFLKEQSALRPVAGTSSASTKNDFLLDGYDWTTIETDSPSKDGTSSLPDGEQSARWYGGSSLEASETSVDVQAISAGTHFSMHDDLAGLHGVQGPKLISHHFSILPSFDPLADGDMGATQYAGLHEAPKVKARLIVKRASMKIRLFDGYDWPENLTEQERKRPRKGEFVIEEPVPEEKQSSGSVEAKKGDQSTSRTASLMGSLVDKEPSGTMFADIPLAEEKGAQIKLQTELTRLYRVSDKYVQLKVEDMFVAESVSSRKAVKMIGEWVNEKEHPRDSDEGLLSMKMITWHATQRITEDGNIASDECDGAVKMIPLRLRLDQRAVRFLSCFFRNGDSSKVEVQPYLPAGCISIPPPLFSAFRFKPLKVKVDYIPQHVNRKALQSGALVELVNLSPIDAMVLTLEEVLVKNEIGLGSVISIVVRRFIQDICSTQLLKFVTNARPLEPISKVGGSAFDMVVLPWEALRNGESIQRALRSGTSGFAEALAYSALTTTSRVAEYVAGETSRLVSISPERRMLPSRPDLVPRSLTDTAQHAVESVTRGLEHANYQIIIVPYREYQRSGTTGALKSVVKGIPVAVAAPASGMAEAISFALIGARNQIQPDVWKEENAGLKGLH